MKKEFSKTISKEIYTPLTSTDALKVENLLFKCSGSQMRDLWKLGVVLGLRISELLQLKLEDFYFEGDKCVLKYTPQKTYNNKTLSINVPAILNDVISNIKKDHAADTYLFQSRNSRNSRNKEPKPVSRQAVYKAFNEVGEILNERLTPHSMRRFFATKILSDSNPLPNSVRAKFANDLITHYYINDKDNQK
jgi:integrase